jgi:hypothetical protein
MVFLLKHWKELYFVVQPNWLLIGVGVEDFVDRQKMLTALVAPAHYLSFVPYAAMMMSGHFVMNVFIVSVMKSLHFDRRYRCIQIYNQELRQTRLRTLQQGISEIYGSPVETVKFPTIRGDHEYHNRLEESDFHVRPGGCR